MCAKQFRSRECSILLSLNELSVETTSCADRARNSSEYGNNRPHVPCDGEHPSLGEALGLQSGSASFKASWARLLGTFGRRDSRINRVVFKVDSVACAKSSHRNPGGSNHLRSSISARGLPHFRKRDIGPR